jgi:uncharacterized protein YndB with AHSA1/START domain
MDKPKFVYVTYIRTTPQKLWQALTDGEFTRRYWYGRRVESDWRVGSRVAFWADDGRLSDSGEILEADPPRRLSYSWTVKFIEELRREPPSRVTFELEPMGDVVKLITTHDQFEPGSAVLKGVSDGWPSILASLKSLLETGEPLAMTSAAAARAAEEAAVTRMRSAAVRDARRQ